MSGAGAAGVYPPARPAVRPCVCDPERKGHEPDPGDGGDPVSLPGRPGGRGKGEPPVPSEAVPGHPGGY